MDSKQNFAFAQSPAISGAAEIQVQILCPSNLCNSGIGKDTGTFTPVPMLLLDPDMTLQVNFAGPSHKEQKISLS